MEQQTQPEQINPSIMEPTLDDGQTDNLPPLSDQPSNPSDGTIPTTTTPVDLDFSNFYTQDEFYQAFKSVFQFGGDRLHIEALPIKQSEEPGARITSNRIYEMAQKYAFLRFIIDKRSTRIGETILMIQFLALKAGDVYREKTKANLGGALWQKAKGIFNRRRQATAKDTAYSVPPAAEKQQKPENSSETPAA